VTLAMTRIQLPSLVPGYPPTPAVQARLAQAPGGGGANVTWTGASSRPVRSLLGEFSITFFPRGGKPVQLEVGANGPAGKQLALSANVTRLVAKSGPRTVLSQHGRQPIRVNDVQVVGGKLVAGASLNKVNSTMDRVETHHRGRLDRRGAADRPRRLSCCGAGCARSSRWPGRPTGSRRAT
jgi:hypothetical protein